MKERRGAWSVQVTWSGGTVVGSTKPRLLGVSAYRPVPCRAGEHQRIDSEPRSIMGEGYKEGLPHVACLLGLALSTPSYGHSKGGSRRAGEPEGAEGLGGGRLAGGMWCSLVVWHDG